MKIDKSLKPVNKQTEIVISKGVHFVPNKKPNGDHWMTPQQPHTCHPAAGGVYQPEFVDLSGRKVGRFTVIHYLGAGSSGARWLVRCSCNRYETRTTKTIKKAKDPDDKCFQCRALDWLKSNHGATR